MSALVVSLAYGAALQSLPVLQFKDRANYLNYAENSAEILSAYAQQGFLTILANEPIWLMVNIVLSVMGNPEGTIRVVIFISATLFSYVLLRQDPRNGLWLALMLLMPQILKNFITHLRQGLGIAIFFAGYFSKGTVRKWLMMCCAPFIHASFVFVLPFVVLPNVLRRMSLAIDTRLVIMGMFSLAVSLSLGLIAALVGARQAGHYDFSMSAVSGLGFVFWTLMMLLMLLQGKEFIQQRQEALGILLLYLLSYFFVEVTARIFESGLPLVLLAGIAMRSWRRWVFILALFSYSMIEWVLRLQSATPF